MTAAAVLMLTSAMPNVATKAASAAIRDNGGGQIRASITGHYSASATSVAANGTTETQTSTIDWTASVDGSQNDVLSGKALPKLTSLSGTVSVTGAAEPDCSGSLSANSNKLPQGDYQSLLIVYPPGYSVITAPGVGPQTNRGSKQYLVEASIPMQFVVSSVGNDPNSGCSTMFAQDYLNSGPSQGDAQYNAWQKTRHPWVYFDANGQSSAPNVTANVSGPATSGLGGSYQSQAQETFTFGGAAYAALGDSYAAGAFPPYVAGGESCLRSQAAYPEIYAENPARVLFLACSGASSQDVVTTQLKPLKGQPLKVVSVSVGGNDGGLTLFAILKFCVLYRTGFGSCLAHEGVDIRPALVRVQSNLEDLYRKIHEDYAPNAKIFAVGYPNPLPKYFVPGSCPGLGTVGGLLPGIAAGDVRGLHDIVENLDATIRKAAHDVGFVQYVEPWSGHDVCSTDSWFYPLNFGNEALHPTDKGQKETALDLRGHAGPPPQP